MLVIGELSHKLLVRMAKWVADDVFWLEALAECWDQALLKELVGFAADGGVIAVEIGGTALEEVVKLCCVEHGDVLVGAAFAAGVAVFDDGVALPLQHLGEAQGFAGEGAVAIGGSVLGVENAD
jgi:hypothetical protein